MKKEYVSPDMIVVTMETTHLCEGTGDMGITDGSSGNGDLVREYRQDKTNLWDDDWSSSE